MIYGLKIFPPEVAFRQSKEKLKNKRRPTGGLAYWRNTAISENYHFPLQGVQGDRLPFAMRFILLIMRRGMSLFDRFKLPTQYSQNTQNPLNKDEQSSFENIENIEYTFLDDTFRKVGRYRSEEHLYEDLRKYPRLVPCPRNDYHWEDKEKCYTRCKKPPCDCVYFYVAPYEVRV